MKKKFLIFSLLIFLLSFVSFYRAFNFDFWGEDWEQMWYAMYDPSKINTPSEMQHPNVIYEELLLIKVFGLNPFYWQVTGYLLKVIDAFAVSLMVLGLTGLKKTTYFAGLIYAAFVGGMESVVWTAAHSSALVIPFLCLGIYFWVKRNKFIWSLIFLSLTTLSDPLRGAFGVFIVCLWETLSLFQNSNNLHKSLIRMSVLFSTLLAIFLIFHYFLQAAGNISVGYSLGIVFSNFFRSFDNFLTNVGNLLVGWIIPISENALAVSTNNMYGKVAGYLFLLQTLFLLIFFFQKKTELSKNLLVFSVWIPIFFLPNWLFANQAMISGGQVLGLTHRYLTLSAVGLVCWLTLIVSSIRNRYLLGALLIIIICSNLLISNWILGKDSFYRSTSVTNPIWDKIDKEVPNGENSLFTFRGEDKLRLNQLAQARLAFGIKRGINNFDKLPKSTVDTNLVKALLCGQEVGTPRIPLEHLHVWEIKDKTIENISDQGRKEYINLDCNRL